MAVLKIKKYPDPILRKKAKEIKKINKETEDIFWDMLETMLNSRGIGLAAPQIGASERIIAVRTERGPEIFINPKIIKKSRKTEIREEGCLSFPGLWLKIRRPIRVEIEALNEEGEKNKIKVEGILARIFQHEIDHLNGILFIDRLSFFKRLKIRKKLKEIKKNNKWN